MGFSLEQVAGLLDRGGALSAEKLRGMLVMRQAEIARELQDRQARLTGVEARLRQIEQEGQPSPDEIVVKSVPAQPVAPLGQIVPNDQPAISRRGFRALACEQIGLPLKASRLTRMMITLAAPFLPMAREILEMMYEFEKPYGVDSGKFERAFGMKPTPIREAAQPAVAWYREWVKAGDRAQEAARVESRPAGP